METNLIKAKVPKDIGRDTKTRSAWRARNPSHSREPRGGTRDPQAADDVVGARGSEAATEESGVPNGNPS